MQTKFKMMLGAAVFAAAAAASAQGYVAVSAGQGRIDTDCGGASTCDKTGSSFKLLGGWTFMPNVSAEVGYFDFGKARFADAIDSLSVKTTAIGGGVAYHVDIAPQWNFVGRLGLAQVKTKLDATSGGLSGSDSDNNAQLYGGLGLGYKLNKTTSLDLAWETTRTKYSSGGVSASDNVHSISLGVTFGF